MKNRCPWVGKDKKHYEIYHDQEWGVSVFDDRKLFEFLILEGAQAGLNWETILLRRDNYRRIFFNYNLKKLALLKDLELNQILKDPGIIRNRLKVYSVRKNAQACLKIQKEFGSFSDYLWGFVEHKKIINCWRKMSQVPASTELSVKISKDLKKRGMTFVGPTIIYAYLQAVGVVNDHLIDCDQYRKCCRQ